MLRQGIINDCDVWVDETDASIVVLKQLGTEWVETLNYRARNLTILSEHLRDQIGYGPAVDLLTQWGVPHNSLLWTLGHKGGLTHFNGE